MTLREAKASIEEISPGYLTDSEKTDALLRLEYFLTGAFSDYYNYRDDLVLSLPRPFQAMYTVYLQAHAEAKMEEYERYNNTISRFRTMYTEWQIVSGRNRKLTRKQLKLI